jgi:hypothetical protein
MNPLPLWALSLLIIALLFLAAEIGRRIGLIQRKQSRRRARIGVGTIQAAVFGLLGLLLAFTYAFVSARFEARRDMITREANAIGTAHLRADLLPPSSRDAMRALLEEYTRSRVVGAHDYTRAQLAEVVAHAADQHRAIWDAAIAGVAPDGFTAADSLVIASVNDVIDTHTLRVRAATSQLPLPVIVMLLTVAALAITLTTFNLGVSGRRGMGLSALLVLMIATVVLLIMDLDYPRSGLIQIHDGPLAEMAASFDAARSIPLER